MTTDGKEQIKKQAITVRLSSEGEEVNATAVGITMTAITALITEAHADIAANEELLIKARPFTRGSFEIPLDLIIVQSGTLFTESPLLEQLLETVRHYFMAKVALAGVIPASSVILIGGHEINVGEVTLSTR